MSPRISDLYLRSQSDARLLSLTRDGHARAFAILVERYRPELLAQARRLGATGNAEDVVQQTLLNAYAALTGGAEVGHLRGWVHAILRNVATRGHGPIEAPLEACDASGDPLEATIERRASVRSVISALADLPSRQRQALLGSSLQGLSRAELASSLGVSEAAVRQLVHRGRQALRGAVTALTPYPLARWLASGPPAGVGTDVALSGGVASAGGALAKLGVFAAVGAIATGVAAVETHRGTHPAPPRHGSASHAKTISQSLKRPTVRASTTVPAAPVREYATDQAAHESAVIGKGHRSDDGAGHTISGGSGQRGDRLRVRSGSGSGHGSGSRSGSRAALGRGPGPGSGSGSGDDSNSGSSSDTASDRSSGSGTTSVGADGSRNSPSSSGETGSDSGTSGNGGSGSGSGKNSRDLRP